MRERNGGPAACPFGTPRQAPGQDISASGTERWPLADPNLEETARSFADLRYRDVFWTTRKYEDRADRIALAALLGRADGRLLEVGAGHGRLADEYGRFGAIVLLDASEALLGAAREQLGSDPRITFVAGDAFRLPFPPASFDVVVCVRVLHHFADPRPAIREFARVLRPGGVLVLESANKRNMKAVLAWLLGRAPTSPLARGSEPSRAISLLPARLRRKPPPRWNPGATDGPWSAATSFVHAPRDVRAWLGQAGLDVVATRSVGLLRLPGLTPRIPLRALVTAERLLQAPLAPMTAGPSIFFSAVRGSGDPR